MKKKITVALLLTGTTLFTANLIAEDQPLKAAKVPGAIFELEKETSEKSQDKVLLESLKKWDAFKKSKKGNYTYTVAYTSMLLNKERTVIVVKENNVVERKYFDKKGNYVYTEKGDQLGSSNRGARAVTIDAWYANAKKALSDGRATLSYNRNNGFLAYIRPITKRDHPSYYRISKIE